MVKSNYIHYNMAAVGGFFGGFTVWELSGVLGNAQTINLIGIVKSSFTGDFWTVFLRFLGAAVYFSGLSLSVLVPKFTKIRTDLLSLAVDAAALAALAFIPQNANVLIRLFPVFFAMAFQWTAFGTVEGYVSATIFSTNNYRQFTTSLLSFAVNRDREMLNKARAFGFTLLGFHIGVALACISCLLSDGSPAAASAVASSAQAASAAVKGASSFAPFSTLAPLFALPLLIPPLILLLKKDRVSLTDEILSKIGG